MLYWLWSIHHMIFNMHKKTNTKSTLWNHTQKLRSLCSNHLSFMAYFMNGVNKFFRLFSNTNSTHYSINLFSFQQILTNWFSGSFGGFSIKLWIYYHFEFNKGISFALKISTIKRWCIRITRDEWRISRKGNNRTKMDHLERKKINKLKQKWKVKK